MSTDMVAEPEVTDQVDDIRALKKLVFPLLIAAAGFLLTAIVWECLGEHLHVRPVIPQPFQTKINLCLDGGPYDTAFIGSSRYFHGIDPVAFDAEMNRLGFPTHSYNLGFDALSFQELHFLTEQVIHDPRCHLKTLIIEPSLRVRLAPGLEHAQRSIVLHDWQGTKYVAQLILRGNQDWKHKLYWLSEQAGITAIRLCNVGAFSNDYVHSQEPAPDPITLAGPGGRGFLGLDPHVRGQAVTTADIQQLITDQKQQETAGTARSLNAFEISQIDDLQHDAALHGIRLILLAPPTATAEMFGEFAAVARARKSGLIATPMFSFADPITYFDLYNPDGFVDPDHIAQLVAVKWSNKAADAIAGYLKEHS